MQKGSEKSKKSAACVLVNGRGRGPERRCLRSGRGKPNQMCETQGALSETTRGGRSGPCQQRCAQRHLQGGCPAARLGRSQLGGGRVVHVRLGVRLPARQVGGGGGQARPLGGRVKVRRQAAQAGAHLHSRAGRSGSGAAGLRRAPPRGRQAPTPTGGARPAPCSQHPPTRPPTASPPPLTMKSATAAMRRADTALMPEKRGNRKPCAGGSRGAAGAAHGLAGHTLGCSTQRDGLPSQGNHQPSGPAGPARPGQPGRSPANPLGPAPAPRPTSCPPAPLPPPGTRHR